MAAQPSDPSVSETSSQPTTVPRSARVVIIGGGAAGTSVAYHLSKRGWTDIVLLEKGLLSSGTTWHSAGDIPLMKPTGLIGLVRYGADLYAGLEEETGQSVGWRNCGYIKVARTLARFEDYKRSVSTFNALGGAAEVITPAQVKERWPLASVDDLHGAVWEPGSGRLDPTGLVFAFAKGAKSRGVKIIENCSILSIEQRNGAVSGVVTNYGPISCEIVVNCAGIWSRQIGEMAGVNVPLHATEHFYMLTNPIEGIDRNLPILNDPDANVYMREDLGGLLVGCFEPDAKPLSLDKLPADFSFGRLEEDWDHVGPYMQNAMQRVPAIETAEIRYLMNGPESFTPDGNLLIGEAPELRSFYVLTGFNSGGVAMSAGMGRTITEWIVDGGPTVDMTRYDIRRFGEIHNNTTWLGVRSTEIVGRHMAVPAPGKDYATGRPQRLSPFHTLTSKHGAQYGSLMGWERPLWYGDAEPKLDNPFARPWWLDISAAEHKAARETVALFDLSSFAKFVLSGEDALVAAQSLFSSNMDVPVGRVIYTTLLNENGGIQSDLTVIRRAEQEFLIVTGAGQTTRDFNWIRKNISSGLRATLTDITSSYGVLGVMGPNSRELLARVTDTDMSNAAFPFRTAKLISIGGARVLASRISYAGELGWELYVPPEVASGVVEQIWSAGSDLGIKWAGYNALGSLRMEKAYRSWGRDILPDVTPSEAGLLFAVSSKKEFIGSKAVAKQKNEKLTRKLVQFAIDNTGDEFLYGDEPFYRDGVYCGMVSSAAYGHTVGSLLAFALLTSPDDSPTSTYEVEIGGKRFGARPLENPPYDPASKKMMA
ncbi:GcvT family protein [Labrys okinawensis]|uniref:GcvT family protein n=1 Tax=Labrys okinawensis TaxID=346911 RepID=UPI0039BD05EF